MKLPPALVMAIGLLGGLRVTTGPIMVEVQPGFQFSPVYLCIFIYHLCIPNCNFEGAIFPVLYVLNC